jgi:prepilin peptidase CpaA
MIFILFGLLVSLAISVLACWSDFKGFRIPNSYSIIVIAAFVLAYGVSFLTGNESLLFANLKSHLLASLIVFAVTFAMFALKLLGAGDSKFASALALWIGLAPLPLFLFYMTLMGGILAVIALALRRTKFISRAFEARQKSVPAFLQGSFVDEAEKGSAKIPYGIAISFGFWVALLGTNFLKPSLWLDLF